ncbi:hypothetical protein ACFL1W_01940 [Candidatus Margulisiibacteriota bacterium]
MPRIPSRSRPAIRNVASLEIRGQREARGKAVLVDPQRSQVSLFVDKKMLSYDFSKYMVIDPPKPGYEFKPVPGKVLREIVRQGSRNIVFAGTGQTDNMWCTNSVVVADGELIKRTAPGVKAGRFIPLDGRFPFLVFDREHPGLTHIPFSQGEPQSAIKFKNGIFGPVLIENGRSRIDHIKKAQPNVGPNELLWDPKKNKAAMSAAGFTINGDFIFISLAGNPDKRNESNLQDLVGQLRLFHTTHAILLGVSGDVQQYVRQGQNKESWLIARARADSGMPDKMFPDARPLSNAIIVEERN